MGTGYTRNDTANNIADGNIINASDLDGEFDAIQSAMATGGHTHDGTAAEGGPITVIGPVQDFIASGTDFKPKGTGYSLGTSGAQFTDLYIDGTAYIDGLGESILVDSASKIQFRDSALFINSSADGQLDLEADTTIELTAPTVALTNDLKLQSDSAVLTFGEHDEVTVTHVHNTGLDVKAAGGIDLNLQTSETSVETGNVLGKITFNSPNETATGSSVVAGAAIEAVAEATFASNNNSSALVFKTNTDGAATERMRIKSTGEMSFTGAAEISNTSGDFTFDVAGDIILDAAGGEVRFADGSQQEFVIDMNDASTKTTLRTLVSDSDLVFEGNDGGVGFSALTLDMSEAGAATFNSTIKLGGMTDASTISTTASDYQLQLGAAQSTTGDIGRNISFDTGGVTTAAINTIDGGTGNTNALAFFTSTTGNLRKRLLLEDNGDISFYEDQGTTVKFHWSAANEALGLGTTSPTADIHMVKADDINEIIMDANRPNAGQLLGRTRYYWNGTEVARIEGDAGSDTTNKDDGILRFLTTPSGSSIAEAMRIDSLGNVGIGVVPESWLSSYQALQIGDAGSLVGSTDNSFVAIGANAYLDSTNSRYEYINTDYATQYYQVDGTHVWRTAASGTADDPITWSVAMELDIDGNLGIGSSTANHFGIVGVETALGVKSTSGALVSVSATGTNFSGIDLGTDSIRRGGMYSLDGSVLGFYTNSTNSGSSLTEAMRIDASQRIGMGVSPLGIAGYTKGQLELGSNDGGILVLTDSNTTTNKERKFIAGKGTGLKFGRADGSGAVTSDTDFTVDSTGKVGIGTATPGVLFGVTGEGSGVFISTIENTHATNGSGLKVKAGDDNNVSTFRAVDKDNATLFDVNGGGNVGIKTSFPQSTLHVAGDAEFDSGTTAGGTIVASTFATSTSLNVARAQGSKGSPSAMANGQVIGSLNFNGYTSAGAYRIGGQITAACDAGVSGDELPTNLKFGTTANGANSPTTRMTIENNGDVTIEDGNLVVASGHGIDFSATADGSGSMSNELLDDYEEGTWSPAVTLGTANFTDAYYVKVGNLVTLSVYCDTISDQTSSTTFAITGAPFAVGPNDDAIVGQVMIRYMSFSDGISAFLTGGGEMRLYSLATGGNYSVATYSDFNGSSASVRLMFNYFTDS